MNTQKLLQIETCFKFSFQKNFVFAKGAPQEASWEKEWNEMVAADKKAKGGGKEASEASKAKQAKKVVAKGFVDLDRVDPDKEWKRMMEEDAKRRAAAKKEEQKRLADAGFDTTEKAFKDEKARQQLAAQEKAKKGKEEKKA